MRPYADARVRVPPAKVQAGRQDRAGGRWRGWGTGQTIAARIIIDRLQRYPRLPFPVWKYPGGVRSAQQGGRGQRPPFSEQTDFCEAGIQVTSRSRARKRRRPYFPGFDSFAPREHSASPASWRGDTSRGSLALRKAMNIRVSLPAIVDNVLAHGFPPVPRLIPWQNRGRKRRQQNEFRSGRKDACWVLLSGRLNARNLR